MRISTIDAERFPLAGGRSRRSPAFWMAFRASLAALGIKTADAVQAEKEMRAVASMDDIPLGEWNSELTRSKQVGNIVYPAAETLYSLGSKVYTGEDELTRTVNDALRKSARAVRDQAEKQEELTAAALAKLMEQREVELATLRSAHAMLASANDKRSRAIDARSGHGRSDISVTRNYAENLKEHRARAAAHLADAHAAYASLDAVTVPERRGLQDHPTVVGRAKARA